MRRFLFLALVAFIFTACGNPPPVSAAAKAQSIQFLLSQVRTASGGALVAGKVYFYAAGTSTPKTVWVDRDKQTVAANPYTLDANGTAQLYGDGLYRVVVKDAAGVTRYDRDGIHIYDLSESGNVMDYGAYNDGTHATETLAAFRAAATARAGQVIYAPEGSYAVNGYVDLANGTTFKGNGWATKIIQSANTPVFKTPIATDSTYSNVVVKDLEITTSATSVYTIDIYNGIKCGVVNVHLTGPETTTSDVAGIRFYSQNATNTYFENYAKDNFLQNASVVMRTTDGQVINNTIWAFNRTFALHIGKGQQQILGNQIMGSPVNGGLYIKDIESGETAWAVDALKVEGNFFDGAAQSQGTVPTGWGIYAEAPLVNSTITGNQFYHHSYGGVKIASGYNVAVTSNVFNLNNKSAANYPDISLTGAVISSTISHNTFNRSDTGGGTYGSAIVTTSAANNNVYMGNVATPSYYLAPIFNVLDGYASVLANNTPVVTLSGGNYNTLKTTSTYYLANSGDVTGGPGTACASALLKVTSLADGYTIQDLTCAVTGVRWSIFQNAGTWGSWVANN